MRSREIVHRIGVEVDPAPHQSRIGGEVKDHLGLAHGIPERIAAQVEFVEREVLTIAESGQIRILDRPCVVIREAIDAFDGVAVRQQAFAQTRPDEAGTAGDQNAHSLPRWEHEAV